jgi:phosphopantothenoylcysteine decarboxylase/phosphopantothenate--cysteine ligase
MRSAVLSAAAGADAVVMAAAVAGYRPAARSEQKLKKAGGAPPPLELAENPDILRELARSGAQPDSSPASPPRPKPGRKRPREARCQGCDLLVVNQVGSGLAFGTSDNAAGAGRRRHGDRDPARAKEALADVIWDLVAARLSPLAKPTELAN